MYLLWALALYSKNILLGIDQLVSAITLGSPDETISSRVGKSLLNGGWAQSLPWPQWWIDHCVESVEIDEGTVWQCVRCGRRTPIDFCAKGPCPLEIT